jgi:AGCS family alanine or glycine:cation symporter
MDFLTLFTKINYYLDVPFTLLFLGVGIFLTVYTKFPQLWAFKYFMRLIQRGPIQTERAGKTINAFHALFAAMATSIGIGNVVGPSLAIVIGGPGALFWLLLYAFFGSVTKLSEVCCALFFRTTMADGSVVGGPAQYLAIIHPWLAHWYGLSTIILFAGWSGIQGKALSEILAQHGIAQWFTGLALAALVFIVLQGGAQRVGALASKAVPFMFTLYVVCGLYILLRDMPALLKALSLVVQHSIQPCAAIGGFMGATIFATIRQGTYKGVFITESGMGTASIMHALSQARRPLDQGILAMYSVAADAFLCLLSGLLVIVSGQWLTGNVSNTLVFEVFKTSLPYVGPVVFFVCIILFITTTAIGNSFNGGQSFASFTNHRWLTAYYVGVCLVIFLSSLAEVPLVWAIMDFVVPFVALPNLIGVVWLALKHREIFK